LEKEEIEARDRELENIIRNLMIADYQADRLRDRLTRMIGDRLPHETWKGVSMHLFKNKDKWIRISLKVEEMELGNTGEDPEIK
jgi:hypothetical protein